MFILPLQSIFFWAKIKNPTIFLNIFFLGLLQNIGSWIFIGQADEFFSVALKLFVIGDVSDGCGLGTRELFRIFLMFAAFMLNYHYLLQKLNVVGHFSKRGCGPCHSICECSNLRSTISPTQGTWRCEYPTYAHSFVYMLATYQHNQINEVILAKGW